MSCTRIYDFIGGTELTLAATPCEAARQPEQEDPRWEIVRPNAAALLARHAERLAEFKR